jgi:pantoate--beta-alanine ligase
VEIVKSVRELQAAADAERAAGLRLALVPTMGALHAGHLALIDEARRRADRVTLSIFVNPAQFDARADLAAYPRALEADLAACRARGVERVFVPDEGELYGAGFQTWIEVVELAKPLCGAARPGHFRGVATVVAKLLIAAKPHLAVFGEKDFQQLALVRRLVRDLGLDVEIVGVATLRESDGLALSSRNALLAPEARRQALCLVRALDAAESAVRAGEKRRDALVALAREEVAKAPLARLDYAELRDPETLAGAPARLAAPALLALAAFLPKRDAEGSVRLIDNRVLPVQPVREDRS